MDSTFNYAISEVPPQLLKILNTSKLCVMYDFIQVNEYSSK